MSAESRGGQAAEKQVEPHSAEFLCALEILGLVLMSKGSHDGL